MTGKKYFSVILSGAKRNEESTNSSIYATHKVFGIVCCAVLVLPLILGACYSFNGASVPPHLKTLAIPLLDDQSGKGEPTVRDQLTNKLTESFIRDNNFQLADKKFSDALLEGTVVSIDDQPLVIEAGETVSQKRLTVTVKVLYQDQKLRKKIWEKQFSQYGDYLITGGPGARQEALNTTLDKITEDIVLETVSGW